MASGLSNGHGTVVPLPWAITTAALILKSLVALLVPAQIQYSAVETIPTLTRMFASTSTRMLCTSVLMNLA